MSDSDSISQLSEQKMNVSQLKHGNFSIHLGGKKFESLAFLTKFVSHFEKIGQIDFGANKLSGVEMDNFN